MSHTAIAEILDRSLLDEDFRRAVETNPERTLQSYDLTDEERTVLLSRNLTEMNKFFPGTLYCTIRFAFIENIIAMQPFPDDARKSELQHRGSEIITAKRDRIGALKELLALLRPY